MKAWLGHILDAIKDSLVEAGIIGTRAERELTLLCKATGQEWYPFDSWQEERCYGLCLQENANDKRSDYSMLDFRPTDTPYLGMLTTRLNERFNTVPGCSEPFTLSGRHRTIIVSGKNIAKIAQHGKAVRETFSVFVTQYSPRLVGTDGHSNPNVRWQNTLTEPQQQNLEASERRQRFRSLTGGNISTSAQGKRSHFRVLTGRSKLDDIQEGSSRQR